MSKIGGKNSFKTAWDVISIAWKWYGVIGITLLISGLTLVAGVKESVTMGSPKPFVVKAGGLFAKHDTKLYEIGKDLNQNGFQVNDGKFKRTRAVWEAIKKLGIVMASLWHLYVLAFIIFSIVHWGNESATAWNVVITIAFVVLLQWGATYVALQEQTDIQGVEGEPTIRPLQGLVEFTKASPHLFNPVYKFYTEEDFTQNITTQEQVAVPPISNIHIVAS